MAGKTRAILIKIRFCLKSFLVLFHVSFLFLTYISHVTDYCPLVFLSFGNSDNSFYLQTVFINFKNPLIRQRKGNNSKKIPYENHVTLSVNEIKR